MGRVLVERMEKRFHLAEMESHSALTAFAFISSCSSSSGSRPVLGKRRRPSLASAPLQIRILALATHVARADLVLTLPLPASDQTSGTKSAGNVFISLGARNAHQDVAFVAYSSRASKRWKILRHGINKNG